MFSKLKQILPALAGIIIAAQVSCEKIDIAFEDNGIDDNPEVVQIENQKVEIGTVKQDTFNTSSSNLLLIGTHNDINFGKTSISTYAEIAIPGTNKLLDVSPSSIRFDSVSLVLNPTGNYIGDTTLPFTLKMHELTENIKNANNVDGYYNSRSFSFSPSVLAQATQTIKPSLKKKWRIRMPDALGSDWLQKLVGNANEIQSQEKFRGYFKGLLFETDSSNNKNAFFFNGDSGNAVIRIYYKKLGLYNENDSIDFSFVSAKSFYHYDYNYNGSPLQPINPLRKEYFSSSVTGNKAFISTGAATQIKFSFPEILTLKERFPQLKVVKAVLEIKPLAGSYYYPNKLPAKLSLSETTSENYSVSYLYDSDGESIQYGNLVYDPLNNVNTKYSFTITSFINSLIEDGQFSTKAQ